MVTSAVSATVFKILTLEAIKWLIFPPHPCLTPPFGWNLLEFLDETCPAKTRGTGLPYSENFHNPNFNCSMIHPCDRQTDRRTDGRAIAYSALCICCRALKTEISRLPITNLRDRSIKIRIMIHVSLILPNTGYWTALEADMEFDEWTGVL